MWIPVTLFAAGFQTARTAMQQRLRALLSVSGAGFVRYVYGAPLSLSAVALAVGFGVNFPHMPAHFWPIIAAAGTAQIVGTICLIRAFDARDFAIGTVYSKTEVVQVAVFSLVFLGESLRPAGWLAVAVCMLGIVVLATKGRRLTLTTLRDPAGLYGLAAGGLFGLAAVGIRAASKSLTDSPTVMRAIVTLAAMNTIQTVIHGSYLAVRERDQLGLAFKHWRSSSIVGVLSVCGSACWAIAFTMQNAARVRTFGQIELLFTFVVARVWLHERHSRHEIAASGLVLTGVVGVMLFG
jgi:drug/metabolite transporter (DMT)-like permease